MLLAQFNIAHLAQQGIAPARVLPHPGRLSSILQARQPTPLFEKSNVLVMYVIITTTLWSLDLILWHDRTEARLAPVCLLRTLCGTRSHCVCTAGKTLLAKTLAKVLDVPFSVSDATSFTQVRFTSSHNNLIVTLSRRPDVSNSLLRCPPSKLTLF